MPSRVNLRDLSLPYTDDNDTGLPHGETAYRALRDMLVTLRIRPGAILREDQLTEELGLGRTPIREAIRRLSCEQLVVIHPRRGTFAAEVNITDLTLISAVRLQLEPYVAALAAEQATAQDRNDLDRVMRAADVATTADLDVDMLMRIDLHIHRAIYRAGGNQYLEATLRQYYNLAARIWYMFIRKIGGTAEHIGQHRELLQAILGGEPERARLLASQHISNFEEAIRAVM